jgi:hypothetical protein
VSAALTVKVTRLGDFSPFGRFFAFWAFFSLFGDFSPFGRVFTFGSFLKITESATILVLLFSIVKCML